MVSIDSPFGAKGPSSKREFDPDLAGGPIRRLTTDRVRVTNRGIDVIERHVERFGPDPPNRAMIQRLRDISAERRRPTRFDLNYYTHELREFVRYRRLGWRSGQPTEPDSAYDIWNHTHTAALEDYGLPASGALYHPSVEP